jgi:NAD(P)-dependent dehydrogenase (short-subunit alcohol dehydrogenase family)
MNFIGKSVLITGSGSGIGRASILLFAEKGAKVAINDISAEKGNETLALVKKAGGQGVFIQGDVSISEQAERIVKETVQAFGKLDILVNNAGIVLHGRIDNTSEQDFEKTIQVNVKGPFLLSKYAVLEMKKAGRGVIVNIASVAALKGTQNRCAYSISKGAIISLTKSIAIDFIKDNIRVNCICPGTTFTQGIAERTKATPDPDATMAELIARQPMGRLGKEEEIASAVLFAASDEAGFMTGSVINIDGGATL